MQLRQRLVRSHRRFTKRAIDCNTVKKFIYRGFSFKEATSIVAANDSAFRAFSADTEENLGWVLGPGFYTFQKIKTNRNSSKWEKRRRKWVRRNTDSG